MKKKILIAVVAAVLIGIAIFAYAYKPQRNIASEKATFETTVANITSEFTANDSLANLKFLDKTIIIYGKITNIDLQSNSIMLDNKIYITFTEKIATKLIENQSLKIKGRFIGYDDLISEFRMDQATLAD
ncbi:MAG: hypothetical protein RLZZ312_437 [Bacteroidota bacterium]|jgi:preprotein translocase subunit YajC